MTFNEWCALKYPLPSLAKEQAVESVREALDAGYVGKIVVRATADGEVTVERWSWWPYVFAIGALTLIHIIAIAPFVIYAWITAGLGAAWEQLVSFLSFFAIMGGMAVVGGVLYHVALGALALTGWLWRRFARAAS